jgi:uncharacterized protein YjbJ (UPF0337 family)
LLSAARTDIVTAPIDATSIACLTVAGRGLGNGKHMSILKKIRHKAQTAKGKAKLSTGRATGTRRLRTKGRADRAKGDFRQAADKVKDAFKR